MNDVISNTFNNFWGQLALLFRELQIGDILDVLLATFLIYELIILVRNTRASQIAKGICLLLLFYAIVAVADMRTMKFVLESIMSFGIVVLAVIFQPELRRAIEQVGGVNSFFARIFRHQPMGNTARARWQNAIVAVCDASERMAEERTGAIIVMERNTNLIEVIRTGTLLRCDPNIEMIETIFFEGTPLHDGAMIVRDGRIEAAGCFLPLSNNLELSKDLGTRHRSALGMSENSDAIVIVVSEETGIISLAKSGVMIRRLDRQNLFNMLVSDIIPPENTEKKPRFFKRKEGGVNEERH
ncbi:diadenylate cyclase CdaA [Ruminococcaceae bacterium OttesenSCG-928-I18]|nr:diadenylate cyclase CdaA [Ruminococcaceae bacterium OttesenSCG-928-I18]